jgi:hypothetical protein
MLYVQHLKNSINLIINYMKKTYTITLKGTAGGALQSVQVDLSGTKIKLTSQDSRVTWTNDNVELDFTPPMHIKMTVGALSGTDWDIAIAEKDADQPCFKTSGSTGDKPGSSKPNISERDMDTNCK